MTKNKQRYRWRLLVCGVVVMVVLALVIAAAILLTGRPDSAASSGANGAAGISLEQWLSGSLSPKSFNGTWISGKYRLLFPHRCEKRENRRDSAPNTCIGHEACAFPAFPRTRRVSIGKRGSNGGSQGRKNMRRNTFVF